MINYSISLLHPFTAKAIGLNEEDLCYLHSKPHENALRSLQKEGYKVFIDYFTGSIIPFSKNISNVKKRFWSVSSPLFGKRHRWRKQHSILHFIYNYFFTPDLTIINMSGHGSPYIFKLAKLIKKRNKEYVAMIGGLHISTNEATVQYYKNAHHIIVHTQEQKKTLEALEGFPKVAIKVMPLGIDTTCFTPGLNLDSNVIRLLYVGRITRLKQIELAIETLSFIKIHSSKSIHLTIVGPFSDLMYYKELLALVKRLKLNENVTFTGTLVQKDIIPFYRNANLLLLPSVHESFGMVMVEAMACGTPIAALKGAGGPDEIIEEGVNGLLCAEENYKERILEFVSSTKIQYKIRENCREMVEKKWSISKTTSSLRASFIDVFS